MPPGFEPAQRMLMNPGAEVAVIENSRETILSEGLAYDRCQVGVLTRIDPGPISATSTSTRPTACSIVLRSQIDVVLRHGAGVLNADDPLQAEMAELCDGEVIWYGTHADSPCITAHLRAGAAPWSRWRRSARAARRRAARTAGRTDGLPLTAGDRSPPPSKTCSPHCCRVVTRPVGCVAAHRCTFVKHSIRRCRATAAA
jgi:hypothetical protein